MKTDKPYKKAFTFSAIYSVLFSILVTMNSAKSVGEEQFGRILGAMLIPAAIIGTIARQSKKEWAWGKVGVWVLCASIIFLFLQAQGAAER